MSAFPIFMIKCDECGRLATCNCQRPISTSVVAARTHAWDCLNWRTRNKYSRDHVIDLCPLCQAKLARRDGITPGGRREGHGSSARREFDLLAEQIKANADRAKVTPPPGGAGGAPLSPPPSPGDSDPERCGCIPDDDDVAPAARQEPNGGGPVSPESAKLSAGFGEGLGYE